MKKPIGYVAIPLKKVPPQDDAELLKTVRRMALSHVVNGELSLSSLGNIMTSDQGALDFAYGTLALYGSLEQGFEMLKLDN